MSNTVEDVQVVDSNSEEENVNVEDYLFEFKGAKKNVINYQFIKLVPPSVDQKAWKNSDATGAYCLECRHGVPYRVGNTKDIDRHMKKYHQEFLDKEASCAKRSTSQGRITDMFPTIESSSTESTNLKIASSSDQAYFEYLIACWICSNHRPISIVEDNYLRRIIQYICKLRKRVEMPSMYKARNSMITLSDMVVKKMKTDLQETCIYFSATSDIWTSRTTESYMAFTIHYTTQQFELKSATLDVMPCPGKHTGEYIHHLMQHILDSWNLGTFMVVTSNLTIL